MNEQPLNTILPSEPVCIVAFICKVLCVLAWLHAQLCIELTHGIMLGFSFTHVMLPCSYECPAQSWTCVWCVCACENTFHWCRITSVCCSSFMEWSVAIITLSDQMNVNCKKEMYECVSLCLLISDHLLSAAIFLNLIEHIPLQCA